MSTQVSSLEIVKAILDRSEEAMPGQRYQDPVIEKREDVKRPFYYIRVSVPICTENGIERKRTPIHLGFCDEMSMRQAKAAKQQHMAAINAGKFILQSQIRFADLIERFKTIKIPKLGTATQEKYLCQLKNHIEPAFGEMRLCDIDKMAVEAWLTEKEVQAFSHWTLLDLKFVLSGVFTAAKEWKLWQGDNPTEGIKVGGREVSEKKLPPADILMRFLNAIEDTAVISARGARLMCVTAIASGLRVSEVLACQPRNIDAIAETIKVDCRWRRGELGPTKTKASKRTRQIPSLALELLKYASGKADDEYIFGRADKGGLPPDDRDLQQHVLRPAARRVGINAPRFGMHYFRHVNITWRQQVGAHPFEAQKAAGHSRPSTTWDYTQTDPERERAHVRSIMDRIEGGDLARMKTAGGKQ